MSGGYEARILVKRLIPSNQSLFNDTVFGRGFEPCSCTSFSLLLLRRNFDWLNRASKNCVADSPKNLRRLTVSNAKHGFMQFERQTADGDNLLLARIVFELSCISFSAGGLVLFRSGIGKCQTGARSMGSAGGVSRRRRSAASSEVL